MQEGYLVWPWGGLDGIIDENKVGVLMEKLIRQYDKRTGKTYFYRQEKIVDEETGKVRYKRSIVGKLGENGEVVPTGKVGRPVKVGQVVVEKDGQVDENKDKVNQMVVEIEELEKMVLMMQEKIAKMKKMLEGIRKPACADLFGDDVAWLQGYVSALEDKAVAFTGFAFAIAEVFCLIEVLDHLRGVGLPAVAGIDGGDLCLGIVDRDVV